MGRRLDLAQAIGWVFAAVAFGVGARAIGDNSFLTHLATGRLIVEQGSVPTVDPYTWASPGQAWTVQSWLVSVVYAAIDATAGLGAVRILHGVLGAAIAVGVWGLVAPARQLITRVCLVSLVLLIGTYLWPPRPLLVGLVGTVVVLQVVTGSRRRWLLVPVFWVWVNAHGSFVLGVGLLGAVFVGSAIDRLVSPPDDPELDRRREQLTIDVGNLALAVAGVAAAVVNPLTWRLLWFPFGLMLDRRSLVRVSEWAAPAFRSPVEYLYLVLLVLVVVAASRGARWRALVPATAFAVAGLLAVRNIGLASVVIVVMLAPALEGLGGTIDGATTRAARALAAGAAVLALVLAVATAAEEPLDLDAYPVSEVAWLDDRGLVATDEVRLANRDFVGNYLTYRYGASAEVFMDDRFDFHPADVLEDHNALLLGGDMGDVVERRRFDVVLWEVETPFHRWIADSDEWDIAVDGEGWFVACRRDSPVHGRCR